MLRHLLGNSLWAGANLGHAARFRLALRDPRAAQERILLSFLRRNAASAYGRRHGYAKIRSVEEFQERVPIVTYEDLEPWVERILLGERRVLTAEPVLLVERTSGSSGAAKYIPYTASLLAEFRRALGAWMFDLFSRRPALLAGSQYWSITPLARGEERTRGGLRVGFEEDRDYFGALGRRLLGWVLAVPADAARAGDMECCLEATLGHLCRQRHLRFVSVWSPSFLTLLAKRLPAGTAPADFWPRLELISCWTSGMATASLPELRRRFPGVEIQGKGLLATEGVVSFPLFSSPAPCPAITSHFLEFVGRDGRPRLAHELAAGERYSVVITTGGGFARYDLMDEVEAVASGAIEFVGRRGQTSDLCGEKLSEPFVRAALDAARAYFELEGLAMLAPELGSPPRYLLFVDTLDAERVAAFVDGRLRASCQYDHARRLGQLGPIEGVRVPGADEAYLRACEGLGQRVGGVKPACLRRELGWRERMVACASA